VTRQGTHPGRARQCQAGDLFASRSGNAIQPRHEEEIRAADISRKMQEAGHHSCDAKADRHGQRTAPRPEEMDPKQGLTNTDTQRFAGLCRSPIPQMSHTLLTCWKRLVWPNKAQTYSRVSPTRSNRETHTAQSGPSRSRSALAMPYLVAR